MFNIFFLAVIGNLAIFDSNKKQLVKYGVLPPLVKLAKQPEEIEQISKTYKQVNKYIQILSDSLHQKTKDDY